MIAPWMLSAAEDSFQFARTAYKERSMAAPFRKHNLGLAGVFGAGIGPNGWGSKIKNTTHSVLGMAKFSYGGIWPFLPAVGLYQAKDDPRGEKVNSALGFIGGGLAAVPGALVGGSIGALATSVLWSGDLSQAITRKLNAISGRPRKRARFEFGGEYIDTDAAYTMRQAAAREMAGSLMNARMHLGREATFFHS